MKDDHHSVEARVLHHQPLAPLTTLGVGGDAEYYFVANSVADVIAACRWARDRMLPISVLSGGSNLVVADSGVRGLTLDLRLKGVQIDMRGDVAMVTAAAGENWDEFVAELAHNGYAGLECLSGIPGRVGATPIQNVGAYGQEVGQVIAKLVAYDRVQNELATFEAQACGFGYRTSRFRAKDRERYVILSVTFVLQSDGTARTRHAELIQWLGTATAKPADMREAVLSLRRAKSMVFDPADPWSRSCGSFFVNPVVSADEADRIRTVTRVERPPVYPLPDGKVKIAAAWLIELAGFVRGHREGSVGLSKKHSLAIVAHSNATARDVCGFARRIQDAVSERFAVELTPEPMFWGYTHLSRGLPRGLESE